MPFLRLWVSEYPGAKPAEATFVAHLGLRETPVTSRSAGFESVVGSRTVNEGDSKTIDRMRKNAAKKLAKGGGTILGRVARRTAGRVLGPIGVLFGLGQAAQDVEAGEHPLVIVTNAVSPVTTHDVDAIGDAAKEAGKQNIGAYGYASDPEVADLAEILKKDE